MQKKKGLEIIKRGPHSSTVLFPGLMQNIFCDDFQVFLLKHKIWYFAHFHFYNFIGTFPQFNLDLGHLTKNSLHYL